MAGYTGPIPSSMIIPVTRGCDAGFSIRRVDENGDPQDWDSAIKIVVGIDALNPTEIPTVGTDVPVIIIPVPANSTVQQAYPWGRVFAGLGFAVTGGIASLDNTNAPAGVLISASYL